MAAPLPSTPVSWWAFAAAAALAAGLAAGVGLWLLLRRLSVL